MFQSTHSRGVRLGTSVTDRKNAHVSIHALTRSATRAENNRSKRSRFQSTHSRGVRLLSIHSTASCMDVSIHALTRSATFVRPRLFKSGKFQSTHSRGVRPFRLGLITFVSWFQSTHSRGVRLEKRRIRSKRTSFNPRTHEECDRIYFFSLIFRHLEEGFRELF